ncbi:MAG: hypothetical protein HQL52_08655 [Magnetococcales bacterium]|nr:hypothetical protein [Magnetococcales bacterium]
MTNNAKSEMRTLRCRWSPPTDGTLGDAAKKRAIDALWKHPSQEVLTAGNCATSNPDQWFKVFGCAEKQKVEEYSRDLEEMGLEWEAWPVDMDSHNAEIDRMEATLPLTPKKKRRRKSAGNQSSSPASGDIEAKDRATDQAPPAKKPEAGDENTPSPSSASPSLAATLFKVVLIVGAIGALVWFFLSGK